MSDIPSRTVVYQYGCPHRADLDKDGMTQLWLANRLWNALVEIEHGHEDAKAAIWRRDSACAAAMDLLAACDAEAEAIAGRARGDRQEDRTTVPRDERAAAFAGVKARRRDAKTALGAARAAALPGLAALLAEARQARDDAVRDTYGPFTAGMGLGWATWNDIAGRRLTAARKKVAADREAGHPARLRFSRFDGTGTLTVQVMRKLGVTEADRRQVEAMRESGMTAARIAEATGRTVQAAARMTLHEACRPCEGTGFRGGAPCPQCEGEGRRVRRDVTGDPPRTIPALNSGGHPKSGTLRLAPWQDPAGGRRPKGTERHGTLSLAIGRARGLGPLPLEIPVVLDRWIPADADITEVKVTRGRTGTHARLSVAVVCQAPAPVPVTEGPAIAVRLSWKSAGDGWLTVAHAGSPVPLPPLPASLAGIVRLAGTGLSAEVLYSAEWRTLLDRDDAIRSVRDGNLDAIRDRAVAAMKASPALCEAIAARRAEAWQAVAREGDPPEITAAGVSRWRSHERMRWLARDWPPGDPLAGPLEEWRKRDCHLHDYEAHERAQVLGRRKDAYRCAAAWLCTAAGSLVIDALELPALKEAPDAPGEDPEIARAGRRQMHSAAPGELREAILAAAAARGIPVTSVKRQKTGRKGR